MAPFSQEIVDKIIDNLQTDRFALAACSLVSSSWLTQSRTHLFHAIDMRTLPQFTLEEMSVDFLESRIESFIALTEAPQCTILPYIRRVDCLYDNGESTWGEVFKVFSGERCQVNAARLMHTSLQQHSIEDTDLDLFRSTFSNVTTLEVFRVEFESWEQQRDFLCGFPALKHLHFTSNGGPDTDEPFEDDEDHLLPENLETLTLVDDCHPLPLWIAQQPEDHLSLKQLSCEDGTDLEDLKQLLSSHVVTSLTVFSIGVLSLNDTESGHQAQIDAWKDIPFANLVNLDTLTISSLSTTMLDNFAAHSLLSSLETSSPLSKLTLIFDFQCPEQFFTDADQWDAFISAFRDTAAVGEHTKVEIMFGGQSIAPVVEARNRTQEAAELLGLGQANVLVLVTDPKITKEKPNPNTTDDYGIPILGWASRQWDDTHMGRFDA